MRNSPSPSSAWHWLSTQLLNLPIALVILLATWDSVSETGRQSLNLAVYLIPLYLLFAAMLYFIFWKPADNQTCLTMVLRFVYSPATQCSILNVTAIKIHSEENYVLIRTKFKDKNNITQYGYGCASDHSRSSINYAPILPYKFYKNGESILCSKRLRILAEDGSGGSGCEFSYNQTQVKIASWACLSADEVTSNLETGTCYYAIYGDSSKALANSNPETDMSLVNDFYMMNWRSSPYYDKTSLICLIIFCFIPGSFCIFQTWLVYPAFALEEPLKNFFTCNQRQINIELQQPIPDRNLDTNAIQPTNGRLQQMIEISEILQYNNSDTLQNVVQPEEQNQTQFQQFQQSNQQQPLQDNQQQNVRPKQVLHQISQILKQN